MNRANTVDALRRAKRAGSVKSTFQRVNLKGQTVAFDASGMLEREDGVNGLGRKIWEALIEVLIVPHQWKGRLSGWHQPRSMDRRRKA